MTLSVSAPSGAHFEFEVVKGNRGEKVYEDTPILVWDEIEAVRARYGDEGVKNILDGTSLRVSYQGIARRMRAAGKSDDEIAQAQIEFVPGKRSSGATTPEGRAASAARKASERVSGDLISQLLAKVASGEISEEALAQMAN